MGMTCMRLENKVALITGAGSGIGRATAILFAKEGAKVVVADIDSKGGEETARTIRRSGGKALFVHADVTKPTECQNIMETTLKEYGRLDILFNNAGINPRGTVTDTSEEIWNKTIEVNLKSVFLCSKYAVPIMVKQGGGAIVNTASVNGLVALPSEVAYDASKGGVVMLTKAMAVDHGPQNIRVNCICPGATDTPLLRRYIDEAPDSEKQLRIFTEYNAAIRRLIRPEEIAYAVLFLASDYASAITGISLPVDGGCTAI